MTLTDREWDRLFALLDAGWPGELTSDDAAAYRALLDGVDPARILTGIRRLLHAGARFRPTAAEILGEARRDPSKPTFDEMLVLVFGRRGCLGARVGPGTWPDEAARQHAKQQAVADAANELHPLVAAFVARQGIDRLLALPISDPDEGKWVRKELRESWLAHVDAFDGREIATLAVAGGARELRQLDPLAVLGLPQRPAPALPAAGDGDR